MERVECVDSMLQLGRSELNDLCVRPQQLNGTGGQVQAKLASPHETGMSAIDGSSWVVERERVSLGKGPGRSEGCLDSNDGAAGAQPMRVDKHIHWINMPRRVDTDTISAVSRNN